MVCYAFISQEGRGTFHRFQIATVVTINPTACIGAENGFQDTRVPLKKSPTRNVCVVLTVHMSNAIIHTYCMYYIHTHTCSHLKAPIYTVRCISINT